MTLVDIVDTEDNVIGFMERYEADMSQLRRISALWLTNSKGEVLIAQRALNKRHHAGCWGFAVTGAVEKGESYEDAMKREIVEELGIENLEITKGPKFLTNEYDGHRFFCQYYFATKDIPLEDFRIDPEEVAQIRWISVADLRTEVEAHPTHFISDYKNWHYWLDNNLPF